MATARRISPTPVPTPPIADKKETKQAKPAKKAGTSTSVVSEDAQGNRFRTVTFRIKSKEERAKTAAAKRAAKKQSKAVQTDETKVVDKM